MFIGTEKLTHTYMPGTPFSTEALQDVSFNFQKGEFALILGPSGSGKSTLIQHLNGLLRPTSGQVIFDGAIVGSNKRELLHLRRRIGLVFQIPEEQFFSESVYDEVAFAPRNLGLDEKVVAERVEEALQKVGMQVNTVKSWHPFRLSAGQKRLVAIAAVLSLKPEVLIFDEPSVGLDPAGKKNIFNLLKDLNQKDGLTIIISTHHLDEAAVLADRVLVLKQGRLVMFGSADYIFAQRKRLNELGLALPQVTEIMHSLVEKGLPVSTEVYTLKQAKSEIKNIKRRN